MQNDLSTMQSVEIPVSKLEQMAYGHATAQFISCDNGFEGTWFERYQYLSEWINYLTTYFSEESLHRFEL